MNKAVSGALATLAICGMANAVPAYAAAKSASYISETSMASAMWKVFDATTWYVVKHPAMAQVRVHPKATVTATAYDVSTWLAQWASGAKGYVPQWGLENGKFVPFSLKYELSTDPYVWAKVDGLFQGTHATSKYSKITTNDEAIILSNLKWWLQGVEVVNGVYHLHALMDGNYGEWANEVGLANKRDAVAESWFQEALTEETRCMDGVTFTVQGKNLSVYLPSTSKSEDQVTWYVGAGNGYSFGEYGPGAFTKIPQARGGSTVLMPNNGPFLDFTLYAKPNPELTTVDVLLRYQNGVPNTQQAHDDENQS